MKDECGGEIVTKLIELNRKNIFLHYRRKGEQRKLNTLLKLNDYKAVLEKRKQTHGETNKTRTG